MSTPAAEPLPEAPKAPEKPKEPPCDHTFGPRVKIGRCWFQRTCTKCGAKWEIDSSD